MLLYALGGTEIQPRTAISKIHQTRKDTRSARRSISAAVLFCLLHTLPSIHINNSFLRVWYDHPIFRRIINSLVNLKADGTRFEIYGTAGVLHIGENVVYAVFRPTIRINDLTCDYTFEPCQELLRQERSEAVFVALDGLSYREREVIRSHIGFCPDCHSMKSPKFRPHTFQEIAYKNELSSAEAEENIYRKGLDKMRDKLKKKGIFHP